jgi:hypothetical protein
MSALAAWRKARSVELALEGHPYDDIAKEVGYANRGTAHRVVHKALAAREVEAVDLLRETELERLDALQAALWPAAMSGDISAVNACLRVITSRLRVLGIDGPQAQEKPRWSLLVEPGQGNPGVATGEGS